MIQAYEGKKITSADESFYQGRWVGRKEEDDHLLVFYVLQIKKDGSNDGKVLPTWAVVAG